MAQYYIDTEINVRHIDISIWIQSKVCVCMCARMCVCAFVAVISRHFWILINQQYLLHIVLSHL